MWAFQQKEKQARYPSTEPAASEPFVAPIAPAAVRTIVKTAALHSASGQPTVTSGISYSIYCRRTSCLTTELVCKDVRASLAVSLHTWPSWAVSGAVETEMKLKSLHKLNLGGQNSPQLHGI